MRSKKYESLRASHFTKRRNNKMNNLLPDNQQSYSNQNYMMPNMSFLGQQQSPLGNVAQQQAGQPGQQSFINPNQNSYTQQGMNANAGFQNMLMQQQQSQQMMQQQMQNQQLNSSQDNSLNHENMSFSSSPNTGGIPQQFSSHLFQNQTQMLSNQPQYRQDSIPDWRSVLSSHDRNHVIRQL